MDSNHRPSGYEPDELPLLHAALDPHRCIDLVSQGVIPPVPSALRRFTTRFEMGRGGTSALLTHLGGTELCCHTSPPSSVCDDFSLDHLCCLPSCASGSVPSGLPHDRPVLPDQASPRSSVSLRSTAHAASTALLSHRLLSPGPYQPQAARRLVLQWASHLDAFSGSPSRP